MRPSLLFHRMYIPGQHVTIEMRDDRMYATVLMLTDLEAIEMGTLRTIILASGNRSVACEIDAALHAWLCDIKTALVVALRERIEACDDDPRHMGLTDGLTPDYLWDG